MNDASYRHIWSSTKHRQHVQFMFRNETYCLYFGRPGSFSKALTHYCMVLRQDDIAERLVLLTATK